MDTSSWTLKYYKGLGTSTNKEAKEVFRQLEKHTVSFTVDPDAQRTLDTFYDESRILDRKTILTDTYDEGVSIDYAEEYCTISDFLKKEHIHFSRYSIYRALPSSLDGLTPSRRKVLYYFTALSKSDGEVKVAQAAASVANKTFYLHGENSLVETIVSLAQDHVGTNNVAYLQPIGQFGSRNNKSSVHAAARYIYTRLDPIAKVVFRQEDLPVLAYREEEGNRVEPEYFVPVIPMLLVNGAQGIGTGFSTSIPPYNFIDVCRCAKKIARGEELNDIQPWYHGFKGTVQKDAKSVTTNGTFQKEAGNAVRVEELPIGRWTEPFLTELKHIADGSTRNPLGILNVTNRSREDTVDVLIHLSDESYELPVEQLTKHLRLTTTYATTNMMAFKGDGHLFHFHHVHEIMNEHGKRRLDLYEKRKAYYIGELSKKITFSVMKAKFIALIISGDLDLRGYARKKLEEMLGHRGVEPIGPGGYDYILNMNVSSFTSEKVDTLEEEIRKLEEEHKRMLETTAREMWLNEIEDAEAEYERYLKRVAARYETEKDTTRTAPPQKKPRKRI